MENKIKLTNRTNTTDSPFRFFGLDKKRLKKIQMAIVKYGWTKEMACNWQGVGIDEYNRKTITKKETK